MPPERGEISPGALLSAMVKKDEALPAQVWRWATRSIRGAGSLLPPDVSAPASIAQRVVAERGHSGIL